VVATVQMEPKVARLATFLYPLKKTIWTSYFQYIGILEAERVEPVALTANQGMVEWEVMVVAA
jgi:hypothetical protein